VVSSSSTPSAGRCSAAAGHDHLDRQGWDAVDVAFQTIAERWTEPDAGIWELSPRHWTHSKLICTAGLRAIAAAPSAASRASNWLALAAPTCPECKPAQYAEAGHERA
jgi:hypothetical protein